MIARAIALLTIMVEITGTISAMRASMNLTLSVSRKKKRKNVRRYMFESLLSASLKAASGYLNPSAVFSWFEALDRDDCVTLAEW